MTCEICGGTNERRKVGGIDTRKCLQCGHISVEIDDIRKAWKKPKAHNRRIATRKEGVTE